MTISLEKGGRVNLSKEAPGLAKISVGLVWDQRVTDGSDFDLDASVFLLNAEGKTRDQKDFVFYNNASALNGAVQHTGDNLTGEGEGDDEVIEVDLAAIKSSTERIEKLSFVTTIHDSETRKQNFDVPVHDPGPRCAGRGPLAAVVDAGLVGDLGE
jgi:tellurium resistance protein TerD